MVNKKYCGYKTSQVKQSKSKKTGKSRRSHSRRRCYNSDDVGVDRPSECMIGMSKSCVVKNSLKSGETFAQLETRRQQSRERRRSKSKLTSECGGRDKSECLPPTCTWASGDMRSYCRKAVSNSK
jgi:hypothetical protein